MIKAVYKLKTKTSQRTRFIKWLKDLDGVDDAYVTKKDPEFDVIVRASFNFGSHVESSRWQIGIRSEVVRVITFEQKVV